MLVEPSTGPAPEPLGSVPKKRGRRTRWDWLPLAAVAAAIGVLVPLDIRTVFEPRFLMVWINGVVFVGASGVAAGLAGWGYLANGVQTLLLLGGGMLAFGLACVAGPALQSLSGAATGLAVHNSGALLAGAFHLASAIRLLFPMAAPAPPGLRHTRLAGLYAAAAAALALLTALAASGAMPRFITEAGTTPVRSSVLSVAVMAYLFSALLFAVQERRVGATSIRWYWLGLSLIGLGLAAVGLGPVGSPLSWVGRFSQALGQVYVLLCPLTVLRQRRDGDAAQALGLSFRQVEVEHAAIWDAAAEGILVADEAGLAVYANRRMEGMLGLDGAGLVGRPVGNLLCPRGTPEEQEQLRCRLLQSGQRDLEVGTLGEDGAGPVTAVNSSVVRDARGHITQVVAMVSDITARKRAEDALRASEERERARAEVLHAVMDAAPAGIILVEAPNARIAYANGRARKIYEGCRLTDLTIAERAAYHSHPDGTPYTVEEMPVARALFRGEHVEGEEMVLLLPGGGERTLDVHAAPVGAQSGTAEMAVVAFEDVTERCQAERALRDSEESLRRAQEIAHLGSWDLDLARNRLSWSDEVYRILGLRPQEFGATYEAFLEAVHPDDREAVDAAYTGSLREGRDAHGIEHRVVRRSTNEVRTVHGKCMHVRDSDGRIIRSMGMVHDVTDRKLAEETLRRANESLREADRQKDEFLAMLSHELRNPLAAIASAMQVLRLCGAGDARAERARNAADRQVWHMKRLIDDLLDVARITSGRIELRRDDVSLAEVLDSALQIAQRAIEAKGHHLRVGEGALDNDIRLNGDPARLTQVVANLLDNAAKYTPDGGHIGLEVRASMSRVQGSGFRSQGPEPDAGADPTPEPSPLPEGRATEPRTLNPEPSEVEIRVSDDGMGIPPGLLPHVFELFVQGERSLARTEGGLGIGLTMVRRLVEMHGGTVEARSGDAGLGSEFLVRLPIRSARNGERGNGGLGGEGTTLNPEPRTPNPTRRILVVEDVVDAAEALAMLLESHGHTVQVAHSGPEALEAAPGYRPDLVLLDIGMPGMDGYEVARRLRAEPALAGTILVAVTGYGQEEDRERARTAGFDHHLVKPVALDALRRVLTQEG